MSSQPDGVVKANRAASRTIPPSAIAFADARVVGVGSLPHRDAAAAAAFAVGEFDIATIPSLPKRSPAEGMITQAIAGLPGVSLGQYGSFAVDPSRLADEVPTVTDLAGDSFVGLRAFLDLATKIHLDGQPVKWQFVGPVTLGVALQRAGLRTAAAFSIAADAVRQHVTKISTMIAGTLPRSPQLLMLDEPWLVDLMSDDFPIPPDEAVDLISTAMAAISSDATVGVHCCGPCDVATMLATGPDVISVSVSPDLLDYAGYLARFLRNGGTIAWGVIPTDGPSPVRSARNSRALDELWSELAERGVDQDALRLQSLITPVCGLAGHQVSVARRLVRLTGEVSRSVRRPPLAV